MAELYNEASRQEMELPASLPDDEMQRLFAAIGGPITRAIQAMPSQQAFIDRYCRADPKVWPVDRSRAISA